MAGTHTSNIHLLHHSLQAAAARCGSPVFQMSSFWGMRYRWACLWNEDQVLVHLPASAGGASPYLILFFLFQVITACAILHNTLSTDPDDVPLTPGSLVHSIRLLLSLLLYIICISVNSTRAPMGHAFIKCMNAWLTHTHTHTHTQRQGKKKKKKKNTHTPPCCPRLVALDAVCKTFYKLCQSCKYKWNRQCNKYILICEKWIHMNNLKYSN